MEYFRILNLVKEPFSNSPEPEFFYDSPQHVYCLQNLEMAVRLRRGLNVIIGDVGTGKTTLCRRLISNFDGDETIRTHLVLDPSFNDSLEFLSAVCKMLGVAFDSGLTETEWTMKEAIKNYLFEQGVNRERLTVLVIDEGQKIPDFCIEILREFLNYETNDYKLLQIIIFAQTEFNATLESRKNFADRINYFYELGPLDFADTKAMIRYRIEKASQSGMSPIRFSYPAMRAIYGATNGYPRRIVTLCHQIILTMIIQNRTKVTRALVHACVHRKLREGTRIFPWKPVAVLTGLVFFAIIIVTNINKTATVIVPDVPYSFEKSGDNADTSLRAGSVQAQETAAALHSVGGDGGTARHYESEASHAARDETPVVNKMHDMKKPHTTAAAVDVTPYYQSKEEVTATPGDAHGADSDEESSAVQRHAGSVNETGGPAMNVRTGTYPSVLGGLEVADGWIVSRMIARVRGFCEPDYLQQVRIMNPHIENLDRVESGDVVTFPAVPVDEEPWNQWCWIQVAERPTLDAAHQIMNTYLGNSIVVRLLPYWNATKGFVFSVIVKEGFKDRSSAWEALIDLPSHMTDESHVIETWEDGSVFFSHCMVDVRER